MATYKSISKNFTFGTDFAGGDDFNLISTSTASADSVVNITSGIDSTYNVYKLIYNNYYQKILIIIKIRIFLLNNSYFIKYLINITSSNFIITYSL